jgi:SepF-like predicted cell division protein (DUF552 family)
LRRCRNGQNNLGGACDIVANAKTASAVLATLSQRPKQLRRHLRRCRNGQNNFGGACDVVATGKTTSAVLATLSQRPKQLRRCLRRCRKRQNNFGGACDAVAKTKKQPVTYEWSEEIPSTFFVYLIDFRLIIFGYFVGFDYL